MLILFKNKDFNFFSIRDLLTMRNLEFKVLKTSKTIRFFVPVDCTSETTVDSPQSYSSVPLLGKQDWKKRNKNHELVFHR